jgi:hypothetical protein
LSWPAARWFISYAEKPNTAPPASEGQNFLVIRRHSTNVAQAASGAARITSRLKVTIGPAVRVSGHARRAIGGIAVTQARECPAGARIRCEKNGFRP